MCSAQYYGGTSRTVEYYISISYCVKVVHIKIILLMLPKLFHPEKHNIRVQQTNENGAKINALLKRLIS